jgi:glycine/D-amino acid oxidase-like deaminating enzyme
METPAVDVVVIGGGVQGLVMLDALVDAGYSCALVTEGDLGAGQTLHSHGFLNTGFGLGGKELPQAATQLVHPALRARGVALAGNWSIVPPGGLPGLLLRVLPAFAQLPPAKLPPAALLGGASSPFRATARALPDYSFNKRELVTALSRGREDRIIRATVSGFRGRDPVEAVVLRPDGGGAEVELRARVVVVAAGVGSKRLLRALVGATPQLDQIKHRVVHMLCLRAPRGALPAQSVAALGLGLLVAAHDDGAHVTWYVTPMRRGDPSFDDVPNDAEAPEDPALTRRAWDSLRTLYPALPDIAGLEVGHYAGYRQDFGDRPGKRLCAAVAGAANVIVTLPSGLVGPWRNAADALTLLRGIIVPSGAQPALPGAGQGVRVGLPVEDRPGFVWQPAAEWSRALEREPVAR